MRERRTAIILGLALALQACAGSLANPLIGRWQSDATATIAEFRKNPKVTDRFIEKLVAKDILGKMTYDIDSRSMTIAFLGNQTTYEYSVKNFDGNRYVLSLRDPATGNTTDQELVFEDPVIKVWTKMLDSYEVFRRIQ